MRVLFWLACSLAVCRVGKVENTDQLAHIEENNDKNSEAGVTVAASLSNWPALTSPSRSTPAVHRISGAARRHLATIESGNSGSARSASVHNVSAQLGDSAFLRCTQPLSSSNDDAEVSWLRLKDYHLLTTGSNVFTADQRVQIFHDKTSGDWVLRIRLIKHTDTGLYECQISTGSGKLSQLINLTVFEPVAFIDGDHILHVQTGSQILFHCIIKQVSNPPSFVDWYHDNRRLNIYQLREDIQVSVVRHSNSTSSVLNIGEARESDAGQYKCTADNTRPDTAQVFVSQGDKMAAILRRKGKSGACWLPLCMNNTLFLLPLLSFLLK